ncbi:MAG: hypothetical protein OXE94_15830 [Aestuariivita sp.]|nr:hypothetical protein [Aestuariivita sp.]MCY4203739.1 hypothetical protein [Aestuariivita sp.]
MNNDVTEEPSAERDNALAIAELKGQLHGALKTIRAENEAMESRIDTRLAENQSAMDRLRADMATHREDAAKRETRLILAIAVIVGVGLTIFGFLTASPSP